MIQLLVIPKISLWILASVWYFECVDLNRLFTC